MEFKLSNSGNPYDHARRLEEIFSSLKDHCHSESAMMHDPQAKALLETTADVLDGLGKAFHDYLAGQDEAWKPQVTSPFTERPQESSDPWD